MQITRALSQRLKPNGRLLVIDFIRDMDFDKLAEQGDLFSHTVAHKHGDVCCRIFY